jgi:hypothetical protein
MRLNDHSADPQAHPETSERSPRMRLSLLEPLENTPLIFLRNAHSVVLHLKTNHSVQASIERDFDGFAGSVPVGICEQV